MTLPRPYLDYEPDTVTPESIAASVAFERAQDALRTATASPKARKGIATASTPLLAPQGPETREEQRS